MGSAYRWAIVPAIRFSPQVEGLGLDLRIELRKTTIEPLQDMPSRDSSQVRCINSSGIDNRIAYEGKFRFAESLHHFANTGCQHEA